MRRSLLPGMARGSIMSRYKYTQGCHFIWSSSINENTAAIAIIAANLFVVTAMPARANTNTTDNAFETADGMLVRGSIRGSDGNSAGFHHSRKEVSIPPMKATAIQRVTVCCLHKSRTER